MKPVAGQVVHYMLTREDAAAIGLQRTEGAGAVGNDVAEGDQFPAMVIRVWPDELKSCNLQVYLDGPDAYWAASRPYGDGPGSWLPSPASEREAGDRAPSSAGPIDFSPYR